MQQKQRVKVITINQEGATIRHFCP